MKPDIAPLAPATARPCSAARLTAQAVGFVLGPTAGRGSVVAADVLG